MIRTIDIDFPSGYLVHVAGDHVEIVKSFTYLGINIHNTESSEHDIRTAESNLAPLNTGLATAYHQAQNRQVWSKFVETATSSTGQAT